MEDSHSILDRSLACHTLDSLDDNRLCLLVGSHPSLVHDFVDVRSCLRLCLILEAFDEFLLSLVGRETCYLFEHLSAFHFLLIDFLSALIDQFELLLQVLARVVVVAYTAIQFALLLLDLLLLLFDSLFVELNLLIALISLTVEVRLHTADTLLSLQKLLLLKHVTSFIGFSESILVGLAKKQVPNHKHHRSSYKDSDDCTYQNICHIRNK